MEGNRGGERAEGEGRGVSDSGIRQLGQAAWLEAGIIVSSRPSTATQTLREEEGASDRLFMLNP